MFKSLWIQMLDQVTTAGNLVLQTKTLLPETNEAAIAMQKDIRVIMNVCPDDINKDIDNVRAEFRVGGRHESTTGRRRGPKPQEKDCQIHQIRKP